MAIYLYKKNLKYLLLQRLFNCGTWKEFHKGSLGIIDTPEKEISLNSGFSVVKYTGNGSSGATVAHGLGAAPKMVMVKGLGDTYGWKVWHTDLASGKTLKIGAATSHVEVAESKQVNKTISSLSK